MQLAEVLIELETINDNIETLNGFLFGTNKSNDVKLIDTVIKELLSLLDKKRSHLILLTGFNNKIFLKIGTVDINLATALIILNTIKSKIDIVDNLLNSRGCDDLDVLNLLDQKDKLVKEYNALSSNIKKLEWSVDIDDKKNMGKV